MRKSIVTALMAATTLLSGTAVAQRGERSGDLNQRGEARQAAQQARLQQRAPEQRGEQQAQAQAQPRDRADGGRQWRGNSGDVQAPRPPRPVETDAGFAGRQRGDRRDRADVDRGRPDPVADTAPGARRTEQVRFRDGNAVSVTRGDRRIDGGRRGDGDRANDRTRNADRAGWNGNRGESRPFRDDRQGYTNRGDWNRNWRQDDRYDWNQRRDYNRNAYHLPRYYAPSGWNYGYRRFNVGFTLSAILFNRTYWLDDADYYGLPEAYGPYRWVRYYNDALLVDIYSGQVVDTVYDIFW